MSYTVELVSNTGELQQRFTVEPEDNILTAGLRAGAQLPYSCRGGCCGSCEVRMLAGEVDYKNGEPAALTSDNKAILCQAYAKSDLRLVTQQRSVADIEPRLLPVRIQQLEKLSDDVMRMVLQLPPNQQLDYHPGQYLDFILSGQKRRSFSMAAAEAENGLIDLHIRKVDGGWFTTQVFEQYREKQVLRIEAPLGQFHLHDNAAEQTVMVAGGTGYAPIRALLQQLLPQASQPIRLYWGVRTVADCYAAEECEQWQREYPQFDFIPVYSSEAPPGARSGWVTEAVCADYADMARLQVYMAGPPPMVAMGREAFIQKGLPSDTLFVDSFEFAVE